MNIEKNKTLQYLKVPHICHTSCKITKAITVLNNLKLKFSIKK